MRFSRVVTLLKRITAVVSTLAFSACTSNLSGRPSVTAYDCGDFTGNHCYATGSLSGPFTGFRSTITVASQFLPGDEFVTNEFWLNNFTGNRGWIELGYKVHKSGLPQYFWAVQNPADQSFNATAIGSIPQQEMGSRVTFDIHQIADGSFVVSVDGAITHFSTTVNVNLWNGSAGGWVSMGQELAGKSGVAAGLTMFVDNQVYDQNFARRFAIQSDGAGENLGKPPFGGWMQKPARGNKGGVFSTYCCAP